MIFLINQFISQEPTPKHLQQLGELLLEDHAVENVLSGAAKELLADLRQCQLARARNKLELGVSEMQALGRR